MSRPVRRFLLFAPCIVVAILFATSAAAGAIRYASPGAVGPEPCNPNPCSLLTAVNNAGDGDQVIVNAGNYTVSGELLLDRAQDVGGRPGSPAPRIDLGTQSLRIDNPGA